MLPACGAARPVGKSPPPSTNLPGVMAQRTAAPCTTIEVSQCSGVSIPWGIKFQQHRLCAVLHFGHVGIRDGHYVSVIHNCRSR